MLKKLGWITWMLLASSTAARAGSVSNEITSTSTQSAPENPRGGSLADTLEVTIEPSESFSIEPGITLTSAQGAQPPPGSTFATRTTLVTNLSLGLNWDPSDHWSLATNFSYSPTNTQYSSTPFTVDNANGTTSDWNGNLRAESSSGMAGLSATYDTAGDSALEWSFTAGADYTHLDTQQKIVAIEQPGGRPATAAQVQAICAQHPRRCPRSLLLALRANQATLDSGKLSGGVTATLWQDTDLGLDGEYYVYAQDPAQIGYYSVANAGHPVTLGSGTPIAPYQFTIRPVVEQRLGSLSLRAFVQYGQYVSGTGDHSGEVGLKVQYKFTKSFRMWISGSGESDVDQQQNVSKTGSLALGALLKY